MRSQFRNLGATKRRIIKELWRNKEKKRSQLVKDLKLARTTTYDNLGRGINSLLGRGIVKKREAIEEVNGRGRPPVYWSLTQEFIDEIEEHLRNNINK